MNRYQPDYQPVFNDKGHTIGYIDRKYEHDEDPEIYVQLPCSYVVKFWIKNLPDHEYIKLAQLIKKTDIFI